MCLVAIAWRAHPRYPLIVAGNRDEFHGRPAAPAGWWEDAQHVLGGRDLVAGGSWLAVSDAGRFAVVINDPRRPPGPERTASRGALVREFVAGDTPSGRYLDAVAVGESRYAGFCLVVGNRVQLRGFVTSRGGSPHRWTLRAGVSVLSNSPLESPWPKVGYLEAEMRRLMAETELDREALFAALGRREPVGEPGEKPADPPAGRAINPVAMETHPVGRTPFVLGERYGTRASTLVAMDADGVCSFEERRFDSRGEAAGESREQFRLR